MLKIESQLVRNQNQSKFQSLNVLSLIDEKTKNLLYSYKIFNLQDLLKLDAVELSVITGFDIQTALVILREAYILSNNHIPTLKALPKDYVFVNFLYSIKNFNLWFASVFLSSKSVNYYSKYPDDSLEQILNRLETFLVNNLEGQPLIYFSPWGKGYQNILDEIDRFGFLDLKLLLKKAINIKEFFSKNLIWNGPNEIEFLNFSTFGSLEFEPYYHEKISERHYFETTLGGNITSNTINETIKFSKHKYLALREISSKLTII